MEILKISSKNKDAALEKTISLLEKGKVVVCPTDTVYGILAEAASKKAVKKVFAVKGRPTGKPLPIFVKDIRMAKKLAFISSKNQKFLKTVWPGKVTAVLKRKKTNFPKELFGKDKTIGIRIPDHSFIKALMSEINSPLTGTSANISGKPPSTNIKYVLSQFKKRRVKPDLILDGGNLSLNHPSTVIDLTQDPPKILRK